jgi:vancomycin permeability regulator SanA
MGETEYLKERIKSEQEKLNDLLKSGEKDTLALDETAQMSRELDKLIVEFLKLRK